MDERGVSEEEVLRTALTGEPAEAREPRQGRQLLFKEGYYWVGDYYRHKRVRVILAEEADSLIVVTVYAYYGEWEGD